MLDFKHMEGKRDNASRDAESYLLLLAMTAPGYAGRFSGIATEDSFDEERRELASAVLGGRAASTQPAEMMNNLSPSGQAELARILLLKMPEEQDVEKLYGDCVRTLETRRLTRLIEAATAELEQPGLTAEEKAIKKQELTTLLKKLSDIRQSKR